MTVASTGRSYLDLVSKWVDGAVRLDEVHARSLDAAKTAGSASVGARPGGVFADVSIPH
jgi:hypothetical protein